MIFLWYKPDDWGWNHEIMNLWWRGNDLFCCFLLQVGVGSCTIPSPHINAIVCRDLQWLHQCIVMVQESTNTTRTIITNCSTNGSNNGTNNASNMSDNNKDTDCPLATKYQVWNWILIYEFNLHLICHHFIQFSCCGNQWNPEMPSFKLIPKSLESNNYIQLYNHIF